MGMFGIFLTALVLVTYNFQQEPTKEQVQELIRTLNDDDPQLRDVATKQLSELWEKEDVIKLVEQELAKSKGRNEEVFQRCQKILNLINFQRMLEKEIVADIGQQKILELYDSDEAVILSFFQKLIGDQSLKTKYRLTDQSKLGTISRWVANRLQSTDTKKTFLMFLTIPYPMKLENAEGCADGVVLLLNDQSKDIRLQAVTALGQLGAKRYAKEIAERLKDKDPSVVNSAVSTLSKLDAREYANDIAKLLGTLKTTAKAVIINVLANFDSKEHAKDIALCLKDPDLTVRSSAISALAKLSAKDYAKDIAKFLKDVNPEIRANAILALGNLDAKEFANDITALLSDVVESHMYEPEGIKIPKPVAAIAAKTLAQLKVKDVAKALAESLKIENNAIRSSSLEALVELDAKEYIKEIVPLLNQKDQQPDKYYWMLTPVRGQAALALGALKATEYAKDVAGLLKDNNPTVRSLAAVTVTKCVGCGWT